MLGLRWFNRHARWERDIDAYVDAELPEPQRALFASHLAGCDICGELVAEASALKRMLSEELTEQPVPRSFRLTPAMLADAAPVVQPAPTPWWPRAAQAVGGLAVAAFAFLLVVDLSATSNDTFIAQSSAEGGRATLESSAPEVDASDDFNDDLVDDEAGTSAASATGGGETEIASAEDGGQGTAKTDEQPNDQSGETSGRSTSGPGSGAPSGGMELAGRPDDSGIDGLLYAQIASVVVALAAGMTYLASRRMRQE